MAKLYPPIIENCIMFKTHIEIPFKHNIAVNPNGCLYALRVKTISTNKEIINLKNGFIKNNKIYFNLESYKDKIKFGEYYKIQVAYVYNATVGYYSSLALARCTEQIVGYSFYKDKYLPNKFYLNINRGINDKNDTLYTYRVWLCELNKAREADFSDEAVQFEFLKDLKNISFNVIGDTGVKVINVNDYIDEQNYKINFEFNDIIFNYLNNKYKYFLIAKITTINGVELKTAPVLIPLENSELDLSNSKLEVDNNFEYGYIKIKSNDKGYLSKSDNDSYYPIQDMEKDSTYYDFCIEQGKEYTYTLGKEKYVLNDINIDSLNSISYSSNTKGISIVRSDFEDMSLWDGEKILRLKYNPQVSSYKTTRPEQKVETLGSQYPFVFYNTKVGYKEFPISAFISIEADNNDFISDNYKLKPFKSFDKRRESTESNDSIIYNSGKTLTEEYIYATDKESNLKSELNENIDLTIDEPKENFIDIAQEYKNERDFKNKVMNWLNNGKPKLFRSPQEGNFIVQIMGVTMSPNDQLNRKMHTVQMNAVEIAEYNQSNLIKYGLLNCSHRSSEIEDKILYSSAADYSLVESFNSLE